MTHIHPYMPVTVLDFETSGLSPQQGHRVIEVGAVKIRNGAVADTYQSLICFRDKLPRQVVQLTGIQPWELRNAPPAESVFSQLLRFIGEDAVICHNASFEQRFLEAELQHLDLAGRPMNYHCTLKLARRLLPRAPNHRLETLIRVLRIPVQKPLHRAVNDAMATVYLWLFLADLAAGGSQTP